MKFSKNKTAFAVILGSATAVTLMFMAYFNMLTAWQIRLGDMLYTPGPIRDDIVVVAVDNTTVSDKGLGYTEKWKRDIYAKVLENINKYHPKVVVFDFFFRTSRDVATDNVLKKILSEATSPVLIYWGDASKYDPQKGYYVQLQDIYPFEPPLELFTQLENIKIAMAKVISDTDNVIRKMLPILVNENGGYYENFAFTIARIALDAEEKPQSPLITPDEYQMKLKNGKIIKIPLQDGQMFINYVSVPWKKSFNAIPFIDVYNEQYTDQNPEKLFKDKIVLIGPTATYFKDIQLTPMSKKDLMTGIEIHANALQTILDQKFLRNLTFAEKGILIIILAFTAAFTFMFTKIRWSLLYLVGVPAAYTAAAKPMFDNGIILDLVHPFLTVIVTFVAVYLYRYVTEFKEKLALQGAFSKYVNPGLLKQITEHPESLKLGGEKREITVMFTDIVHFTTISEKLKPESLVALLNEYFQAMSDVIMAEGGTVDKFEGDAIMAFFGAPVAQPDHALRATKAALKMRIKLNEVLEKWKEAKPGSDGTPANLLPGGEPKPEIDFRCGLSSGEVIVGNIGSLNRFNYTVMGDIVNLGSRLEGANKKYSTHVMMSQKTHEIIKDQFETRELDIIQVMGKTEPIKVFELIAPKGELPQNVLTLLQQYTEAMELYHNRKFAEALAKFTDILKTFPEDGPSQLYRQRCEVLRDFPPKPDWNGVFEMGSK